MGQFFNPIPTPDIGGIIATLLFKSMPQGFVNPTDSAQNPNNVFPGTTGPVALTIDVINNENPQWTAEPTQNPIETGATISDHVRVFPRKLNIVGFISEASPLNTRIGLLVQSANPVLDALNFLDFAAEQGEPFDFVTGLAVYQNMVITNLQVDRQAQTARGVKFTMTLQEVVVVSSELVAIDGTNVDPTAADSAASVQNLGKQNPVAPTTSQAAVAGSNFNKTSSVLIGAGIK